MFGKKGFIRTMEAVLAIFLLLGLILYIFSTTPKGLEGTPKVVEDANTFIINELTNNYTFRKCIENTDTEGTCNRSLENIRTTFQNNIECKDVFSDFISRSTPPGYSFSCELCKSSRSCSNINAPTDKSVYPNSGFVYSNIKKEGRIIRIYLYEDEI